MGVTIIDVAREAGVSKSTVSLVINGNDAVKMETRYRVQAAIEKLGYVPNLNARNLTKQKTNILGVVMIVEDELYSSYDFDSEIELFSYDVVTGIPAGLADSDYGILTERFSAHRSGGELPGLVRFHRVDGVFVMGGVYQETFLTQLKKSGLPCVAVGSHQTEVDSVSPDFAQAVRIACQHLVETGHKRICFVNCPPLFKSYYQRLEGLDAAMESLGFAIPPAWRLETPHNTGLSGYQVFRAFWESGARPDGVVVSNDTIAMGIMRYLYEKGVRIPDDISIVGYEDSVLAGYCTPPLTTIHISKTLMGEEAARIMLNRLAKPKSRYVSLEIPVHLVKRGTVAAR